MNQYFSANTQHLDDHFLLAAAPQVPRILTFGDTLLKNVDPISGHQQEYTLNDMEYSTVTLSPDASHCLLSNNSSLFRFDFNSQNKTIQSQNIVNGAITTLCYSFTGRFVGIGSQEGKPVIYEPSTGKKYKCRPGHISKVVNLFISNNEQYLCSIGQDKNALIYRFTNEQPFEVAKYFITKLSECDRLKGSFHPSKMIVFLPGEKYLQKLQLIQQRWQHIKMEKMMHTNCEIQLTETPKDNTVVTSSREEVCIWNIKTQEKLFEIQQFHLVQTVSILGTFFGTRDDGQLYRYKREIKEQQPMDIEQNEHSQKIQFQNAQDEEQKQQDDEQQDKRRQMQFKMQKKSKADKIITCMPQNPLTSATRLSDGQRFLFVNSYGCVIQRQEEQQSIIELQFKHEEDAKKIIIARNRPLQYFDINPFALAYASQNQFGLKVDRDAELQSWEVTWSGIRAITMGVNWIAVSSEDQIKIFDMFGHQVRSIAFDRDLIALRSHENMLAAVYHQSIPMFGAQQLAMQLYLIDLNRAPLPLLSPIHVPVYPGSSLNFFDFSLEGMIISQDTFGNIKVFSLERNDWTSVTITGIDDTKKAWIIGCQNYQLIYWKTSQTEDEPTVAPRFIQKFGLFTIPTIGNYPQGAQQMYETLLWNRFSLDHEKARSRLWGRFKKIRQQNHRYYYLVDSILNQNDIVMKNDKLDQKFHSLVSLYLKFDNASKALNLCITCIRSIGGLKKMVQLFDDYKKRSLAIQLEQYCQEKEKEIEYESMKQLQLKKLRDEAEKTIKPRSEDPMRRPAQKKITQSLPSLSLNFSQESIEVNNVLNESNVSGNTQQVNPFLKRKGTQESLQAKKKQITQHVQKFGIKKKVEQRNLSRKL